uniref:Uncharacterized protein n=1 Tax=Panagrolaimus sp. ES5 TaxID=591445 RepID=A0AC34FH44_9BILA
MIKDIEGFLTAMENLTNAEVIPFMVELNQTEIITSSGYVLKQTHQLLDYSLQIFWPAVYVLGTFIILLIVALIVCTGAFLIAVVKYISTTKESTTTRDTVVLNKWEPNHEIK